MFQSISFKGLKQSQRFGYAAGIDFFAARKQVEFKPGLNVLFGPNGSGKSTVLRILGDTMCATNGGISAITEATIRDTIDFGVEIGKARKPVDRVSLLVQHDGQPVIYCDPRQAKGLVSTQFDDDFIQSGVNELLANRSASQGEAVAARMNVALAVLSGRAQLPTTVQATMTKKGSNEVWSGAIEMIEARMKSNIDKGQFTVLLDEPEANFSLQWQARLWALLADPEVANRVQVIVASHSPFVLGIGHATYIDMVPDYRQEIQALLTTHFTRLHQER